MGTALGRASALLVAAIVAASCGSDPPAAPSGGLTGTWSGVLTRNGDRGPTTWQLTQSGAALTGSWSVDYEGTTPDVAGSAGGTVNGARVTLFLAPGGPLTCPSGLSLSGTLSMTGTLAHDRITGRYTVFTCDGVDAGDVDVTRP
jgi:hypothetical protein